MPVLRDYKHASKTFGKLLPNAPKLKFLFHVYFNINEEAYPVGLKQGVNFGLYVKDIKLPSFSFNTTQLNQYNRKRIIQTKIKYDPIQITFHDDNANAVTQLWNAYYLYYYKDGSKPQVVFNGARGNPPAGSKTFYNTKNTYIDTVAGDNDWGYIGEPNKTNNEFEPIKVPFFKNITVFSFYQHKWVAHTLINPIITQFAHDTHSYSEGSGIMQNTMTVDYETVVYNYGALDGNDPSNIVTGFGLNTHYDREPSPNNNPANNSNIITSQGALNAAGGFLNGMVSGIGKNVINQAIRQYSNYAYNGSKNRNINDTLKATMQQQLVTALRQLPRGSPLTSPNRNTIFAFPSAGTTPSNIGVAGSPPIDSLTAPPRIAKEPVAGQQVNNIGTTANGS